MRRYAARLDLVSPGDLVRFRERHIDDSLRLLPLLGSLPPGRAIDVGSGAGVPGIPLAIADRTRPWRLLEPRSRRAGFLEEVVRALALVNCEVVRMRAEDAVGHEGFRAAHVVAVARALAPPSDALRLLLPLVAPGGIAAVFTGASASIPAQAEEWAPGIATIVVPDV